MPVSAALLRARQNVAWFPKIIVMLGIVVACTNVLLMPLDVATQNGTYVPTGVFPMQTIELVFYLTTIVLFFAVLPFAYFYYEGWSEDDKVQSVGHQARCCGGASQPRHLASQ